MRLFKTLDELQSFVRVDDSISLTSLAPFEPDALRKFIEPYLSAELMAVLESGYTDDNLTSELEALLPYVQRPLARFTLLAAIPSLNLKTGETGFTTVQTNTQVVASKDRTNDLKESLEALAWDAIESLIAYLEENVTDFTEWEESEAYTMATRNFINNALEFDEIIDINRSRLVFMKLRKHMDYVEKKYIYPVISTEMAEDIIEELQEGSLSSNYQDIIEDLQRATAYLSFAEFKEDPKKAIRGNSYLSNIRQALYDTPASFPLWAASDSYDEDHEDLMQYENDNDSKKGVYVFGGYGLSR